MLFIDDLEHGFYSHGYRTTRLLLQLLFNIGYSVGTPWEI